MTTLPILYIPIIAGASLTSIGSDILFYLLLVREKFTLSQFWPHATPGEYSNKLASKQREDVSSQV